MYKFTSNKHRYLKLIAALTLTMATVSHRGQAATLCPAPVPANAQLFSAKNPAVLQGLSRRSQALFRFKSNCTVDHRSDRPKSHQYQSSFCHSHALAELWNSNVPGELNVDPYNLSLQVWVYQNGGQMDKILDTEREKILKLLEKIPPRVLLDKIGLNLLKGMGQGGYLDQDFDYMKLFGYYTRENAPRQLVGMDVSVLTDLYMIAFRDIIKQHPYGISKELVREHLEPVYQRIMNMAFVDGSLEKSIESLDPQKNFAAGFNLVKVKYYDTAKNRIAFFKLLKEFPIGVAIENHAMVIAGYDLETKMFWIRDSARIHSYYKKDRDLVFSKLRDYYYFTRN